MDQLNYLKAKFMAFYSDASLKSRRYSTSLCPTCRSILRTKSWLCRYKFDKVYILNQSASQLRLSASSGCHLCCLRWNDLAIPGTISESRIPTTDKVFFRKSGVWESHDRADTGQARSHSDLLFSQELDFSSIEKIISECGTIYPGNHDEKEILVGSCGTYQQSLKGSLTVRAQYSIINDNLSWDILRSWLVDDREELHGSAFQNEDSSFLPTRLIYLGSGSVLRPKLCESYNLPKNSGYMTLSCNPQDSDTLRLTVKNMETLKQLIPTELLSNTHFDAILLAQKLEIKYIWIDSLCVIQGSPENSAHGATMISDVYGYSICNLAASDSVSGSYVILSGMHTGNDLDSGGVAITVERSPVISHAQNGEYHEKNSLSPNKWDVRRIDLAPRTLWGE